MQNVAWMFVALTALWFGVVAYRALRSWFPWALGGGVFALVTSTLIFGVSQAAFIPLSHHAYVLFRIKLILCTALIIAFLGWFITAGMHHQPLLLWQKIKKKFGKAREEDRIQDTSANER